MHTPLTKAQQKLIENKLKITDIYIKFTPEERETLLSGRLDKWEASIVIRDFVSIYFNCQCPKMNVNEVELQSAIKNVKNILSLYKLATVTCNRCLREVTAWYEQDEGIILCGDCRIGLSNGERITHSHK